MEKEINIDGTVFKIRELKAIEFDNLPEDKIESLKKQVRLSTGISEEEYNNLTIKERAIIVDTIIKINSPEDFLKPAKGE